MSIIAIKSDNADLSGAIVYWRLASGVCGDDLNNALKNAGLGDHLLRMPSPKKALRRALQDEAHNGLFLRAGKSGDPSLYLVRQKSTDSGPEFTVQTRGTIGVGGIPQFECWDWADTCADDVEAQFRTLTERYWHHVFHAGSSDVSGWLIEQLYLCEALSLRESGGVYFVPRHAIDAWRKRAECLTENSDCRMHMIPAVHSDDAVSAVMEALLDECVSFTNTLAQEIEEGVLGKYALEQRSVRAKALLQKLGRYEQLLGVTMADVREQITAQQTNAVHAALLKDED